MKQKLEKNKANLVSGLSKSIKEESFFDLIEHTKLLEEITIRIDELNYLLSK
jgi:hypothetical protein